MGEQINLSENNLQLISNSEQLAYQHETEDFDHLLFKKWFENTGEKIIHTGKQTIIKVLTEILQREMDWNSYLKTELSYYFNDISKELDKVNNAVKDLGDTLRSGIKSLCWDEFDNFIKRYNTFLTNKIDKTVSLNEVHVILRSVKNCQILRKAQENLGKAPENKNDLNNKITESETHVIKQLPSALKSSLKRSFEKYFENNSTEFENILEKLQPEVAQIQNNEMIIKIIHCTVVALYIQTFINYYMETSHSNVSEIFSKGSKDLQNIFKALVPVTVKLDNPMEFISQILESKDTGTESLEVTTCAFVHQHPDLREEHLKAIMDIKGNINWKQREKLLYFVKEQKAPTPDDQMLFFNEVEVKSSWWNWFCCCC